MTNFNTKTEAKLETMNLARKELDSVKSGPIPTKFLEEIKKMEKMDYWTEVYERDGYKIEVDYYTKPDLSPRNPNNGDGQTSLYKVHISIYKEDQKISETFGYID